MSDLMDRREFITLLPAISATASVPTLTILAAEGSPFVLESSSLRVHLSNAGGIERFENRVSQEVYVFSADRFAVTSGTETFSSLGVVPEVRKGTDGSFSFRYNKAGRYTVSLHYRLGADGEYIERWLDVEPVGQSFELNKIELGWTCPDTPPREAIRYDTFWNTPTVLFIRWPRGGLFTGFENPFFVTDTDPTKVSLSYEPSLLLGPGETYGSEPQFIGVFARSGKMIADHYLPTLVEHRPGVRFRNPSGHIPLDWSEIQAMRRFVQDSLNPRLSRFTCALYLYWYPIEQLWSQSTDPLSGNDALEARYERIVENFHAIGGDLIIFNPLSNYARPAGGPAAGWNLAPEHSAASRILALAREKAVDYGFYMGVAAHGDQGNAAALPFAPQETHWKKVDLAGATDGENCMACRGYADWWYEVQRNTIEKFDLGLWSWDPGPGNGSFCYSAAHGHIPGKGAYKGWREATRLTARLKSEFPRLLLLAFYGRKEYGLWGLKNFDLHESYWEQTILYGATRHPDLHDDRINADGARYQSWWNENFRFLPTSMNHALVHRIGENSYDSRLPKVWDHLGWRYSLLSAIASSGSAIACILPESLDTVPGFVAFYRKWLGWARDHFEYVRYNVSCGEQVRPGGVDIHARIKGDHGFIFLCNPGPRPARIQLLLDASIGLRVPGNFTLRELYPTQGRLYFDSLNDRGVFRTGDRASLLVPEYQVLLLELARHDATGLPLVFGVSGEFRRHGGGVNITGVSGQPGEIAEVRVLLAGERDTPRLTLDQRPVRLTVAGPYAHARLRFAGTRLPRALDDWRTPEGDKFDFPFHQPAADLHLLTRIFVDQRVRTILARATPANLAEFAGLLEGWRKEFPHSYAWARPDRLWLAVPFTNAGLAGEVTLRCNDQQVVLTWLAPHHKSGSRVIAYADLTDQIVFGADNRIELHLTGLQANQFMGPLLDYPLDEPESDWHPTGEAQPDQVVYERPIDPDMPVRTANSQGAAPRVLAVQVDPPFIRTSVKHTFFADIDTPAAELRNVWIAVSQSGDEPMQWDADRGKWIFEWDAPDRATDILDVNRAVVWAVSREGIISESFSVPIRWLFAEPSAQAVARQLESPWTNVREDARDFLRYVTGSGSPR